MCWTLNLSGKISWGPKGVQKYLKHKRCIFYHDPKLCVRFQIKITMCGTLNLNGKMSWGQKGVQIVLNI